MTVTVGVSEVVMAEPESYEDTIDSDNYYDSGDSSNSSNYDSSYDSSYDFDDFQLDEYKDSSGLSDYIANNRPMKQKHLNSAARTLSPVMNFIGYLIGGIMVLTTGGIFAITALDLLYIGIPPLRGLLYKGANGGTTGGYSGGYGGYGQGAYGANNMSGGNSAGGFQLISDEAVQCAQMVDGGGQAQHMGMGMANQNQQNGAKSVITTYLKKRMIFMVVFAICSVVLLSSVLMGTGINIGNFIMRVLVTVNNKM